MWCSVVRTTPSSRWNFLPRPLPAAPSRGRGIVFSRFFVSLLATLRENGWTDLHEIFTDGVEWLSDDLIQFWVNSGKRVGGSKVNLLSPAIAIWFDCGLLAVLCRHLATENVMKCSWTLATWHHGGGVCCAAHHSLFGKDSDSVGHVDVQKYYRDTTRSSHVNCHVVRIRRGYIKPYSVNYAAQRVQKNLETRLEVVQGHTFWEFS